MQERRWVEEEEEGEQESRRRRWSGGGGVWGHRRGGDLRQLITAAKFLNR